MTTNLPRLALVGDIRINRTAGGALLLYRLLEEYPADKLLLVSNIGASNHPTELPGVVCHDMELTVSGFVHKWTHPIWPVIFPRILESTVQKVILWLQAFQADAVLSIPWGFGWLVGVEAARRLQLPLHLVVHDDWSCTITVNGWGLQGHLRKLFAWQFFAQTAKSAKTVICISRNMQNEYSKKLFRECNLLMPSRGKDSPVPKIRVNQKISNKPVIAYCGLIHQVGTLELLQLLSKALREMNGILDIYSPYSDGDLLRMGLSGMSIKNVGFLPPIKMAERIGETADALFLPASFKKRERQDVKLLFPSKLADYTAIGLPIIFWGPKESSGVQWALDKIPCAPVIDEINLKKIKDLIAKIQSNKEYAKILANHLVRAGISSFGYENAKTSFLNAIIKS